MKSRKNEVESRAPEMNLEDTVLGIELGSTRIKAVLLNENHTPIASGTYSWESQLVDGIWTYPLTEVDKGLSACYAELKKDVRLRYGLTLDRVGALGVSAMMHGYLPFGRKGEQLTEFRTWRNTMTGEAARELTDLFGFNIPQRWSIAHLYQAILKGEEHVERLARLTTLAGYVHWKLTGNHCVGIGEASGMFPIDSEALEYHAGMLEQFEKLISPYGFPWKLRELLPACLPAGACGGYLTREGASFLDEKGSLRCGIPVAPCEGDAGTGMAATNSVGAGTGNVSAGTSVFAMLATDHELGVHPEISMVTTPAGLPVAMVHCSNCTSDLNAWVSLFGEFAENMGVPLEQGALYERLFQKALEGDADGGGLVSYNYFSGENVTGVDAGRPVFARTPNCRFTLANFMRTHLYSALSTLKIGLDILQWEEKLPLEKLYGHGGFFKTPEAGQRMLSAAVGVPVAVMETAGEGGAYGMALLCAYMLWREKRESLADYLEHKVFCDAPSTTLMAEEEEICGFLEFHARYRKAFELERVAGRVL